MTPNYPELILTFISGLIIGIFLEFIRHSLSVRRSKREGLLPYLRQLYGSISRIMEKTDADKLNSRYERLFNAQIEEKMRESAYKKLVGKDNAKLPFLRSPAFGPYMMFLLSYNSLVEVVRESKQFESVYMEMEKKGLITTLKVHHKRLYFPLISVHQYTSHIVEVTSGIVDDLVTSYELKDDQEKERMVEDEIFAVLQRLSVPTSNLFNFGSQLQKQLKKFV